jgi:heptosyltransferase-3
LKMLETHPALHAGVSQMLNSISDRGLSRSPIASDGPILIHPGSGSPTKNWPAERFLELITHLQSLGKTVRVTLGEVELERWPPELIQKFDSTAPTVRPASYLDLLAEIQKSSAFIGNDSGPTHLAAILGLRTLAIFGPTDPSVWQPQGPRVMAIQHEPISDLPLRAVIKSLPVVK